MFPANVTWKGWHCACMRHGRLCMSDTTHDKHLAVIFLAASAAITVHAMLTVPHTSQRMKPQALGIASKQEASGAAVAVHCNTAVCFAYLCKTLRRPVDIPAHWMQRSRVVIC